jgi:hypothetical protein
MAVMFTEMAGCVTLVNWLEKFAHPFLANHVYRVRTGHYANEEYDHGTGGIIQGYFKVFKTNDVTTVVDKLKVLLGVKKIRRNDLCYCDSGKKYKKCFLVNRDRHSHGIPDTVMQNDLKQILTYNQTI